MNNKAKILVVEDDPTTLLVYEALIKETSNCDVISSKSAKNALEILSQNNVSDFIAVFLDLNLELGMGGLDLLREIKSSFPELIVFIVSASNRKKDISTTLKFGASDFIAKPLNKSKLKKVFKKIEKDTKKIKSQISLFDSGQNIKTLESLQYEIVMKILDLNNGNISKTSKDLGVTRSTIYKFKKTSC